MRSKRKKKKKRVVRRRPLPPPVCFFPWYICLLLLALPVLRESASTARLPRSHFSPFPCPFFFMAGLTSDELRLLKRQINMEQK